MPPWVPRKKPNRSSSPISALESSPKKSASRSSKSPWPRGRPNRCVTRKSNLYRGNRSVVGSDDRVKSGCSALRFRSGSRSAGAGGGVGCCACAGVTHRTAAHSAAAARSRLTVMRMLLVVVRAGGNPALDDGHLTFGQVGTSGPRHPFANNAGLAFEFLNDVAVVRIARNDADRTRLAAARDADERCIRDLVTQVQAAARIPAAGVGMTVGACRAPRGIGCLENIALNAR